MKRLLVLALLTLTSVVGLAASARAGGSAFGLFYSGRHCRSCSFCIRPYNAFSPVTCGEAECCATQGKYSQHLPGIKNLFGGCGWGGCGGAGCGGCNSGGCDDGCFDGGGCHKIQFFGLPAGRDGCGFLRKGCASAADPYGSMNLPAANVVPVQPVSYQQMGWNQGMYQQPAYQQPAYQQNMVQPVMYQQHMYNPYSYYPMTNYGAPYGYMGY